MQIETILSSKAAMLGLAVLAFLVAAILVLVIVRMLFGGKLRMPGSRARQARLGIVDAFDLDRQRQLIIIRRDNTEHLIMIGGPNDVLIESEIVRVESREFRGRDKLPESGFGDARIPAPFTPADRPDTRPAEEQPPFVPVDEPFVPVPLPEVAMVPPPAPIPVAPIPAAPVPAPVPAAQIPAPETAPPAAPRGPTFPLPPRRPVPMPERRPPLPPRLPETVTRTDDAGIAPMSPDPALSPTPTLPPGAPPPPATAPVRPAPPFLKPLSPRPPLRPLPRTTPRPLTPTAAPPTAAPPPTPEPVAKAEVSPPQPAPVAQAAPELTTASIVAVPETSFTPPQPVLQEPTAPPAAAEAAPPVAVEPAPTPAAKPTAEEDLSLEEEMAKLLGRG